MVAADNVKSCSRVDLDFIRAPLLTADEVLCPAEGTVIFNNNALVTVIPAQADKWTALCIDED